MSETLFAFKSLALTDLDLLCTWFSKSHVKEWWNDNITLDEIRKKYTSRIHDDFVKPFIVYYDDKPFGFIQYYYANKVGEPIWVDEDNTAIGIDQFIGDESKLSKGLGTKMTKEFITRLFSSTKIVKVLTNVDPKNARAIKCYENVGFIHSGNIMTSDGLALLMSLKKDTTSAA